MPEAVLALGSNLGDPLENLRAAVRAISLLPGTQIIGISRLYKTSPVGFADQPDFLNAAVRIQTSLPPHPLLGACLGIEAALGRMRSFSNAPRTLDIDLLLVENTILDSELLTLPHPRMLARAFVLVPLLDLYPDGAALGLHFLSTLQTIGQNGVRLFAGNGWADLPFCPETV